MSADLWTDVWHDFRGGSLPAPTTRATTKANPFTITLYDKTLTRTGWLNDPASLKVVPRHDAIGTAEITVPSSHRKVPRLAAKGARAVIEYHGEHLMSGYIRGRSGQGPTASGQFTYTLEDDLGLVQRMLGWAKPDAAINAQTTKADTRTGPAETVAKAFVEAQLAHNTVDLIQVAPSLGRGSVITVSSRMKVLSDQLMDAVDKAGVGLSAKQVGSHIVLDAYTPRVYPHTLSEAAGTITNWSWSDSDPAMTRAIIGGPNTDTSREFRQIIDSAREEALGYTVEGFVDAQSATGYTEMDAAGTAALAEAGPKAGFSLELSETKNFRYGGDGVRVGDQVTVDIGGQTMTDILREATLLFDPENGLVVTPTIGEHSDDSSTILANFLTAVRRGISDFRTR